MIIVIDNLELMKLQQMHEKMEDFIESQFIPKKIFQHQKYRIIFVIDVIEAINT